VKKPPTVFIVDHRPAILSSLEGAVRAHGFLVQCYNSAAQFIADAASNRVGCVLVDPLIADQGGEVLRWLHESDSLLSVVLITGLIELSGSEPGHSLSSSVVLKPHEDFALMTMVTDGLAGSISRDVIRKRSPGLQG
jgi:FixJ family two-component response regulator